MGENGKPPFVSEKMFKAKILFHLTKKRKPLSGTKTQQETLLEKLLFFAHIPARNLTEPKRLGLMFVSV
jgi:hypothetical protein